MSLDTSIGAACESYAFYRRRREYSRLSISIAAIEIKARCLLVGSEEWQAMIRRTAPLINRQAEIVAELDRLKAGEIL